MRLLFYAPRINQHSPESSLMLTGAPVNKSNKICAECWPGAAFGPCWLLTERLAMKRLLYYLICAIACTFMVSATLPMPAIAEAMQPQSTAEQQAQADATNGDTGKAEDGTNTKVAADTVEDSTATSTGTSAANTESADAATGTTVPSLRAQATPRPRQSPPRHKPATPTPPPQPKMASPSPSRGTTPPRAPRRPST